MLYPKEARLRKRSDFLRLRKYSKKFTGESVIIRYREAAGHSPRLGITPKRTHGKAHDRNLFKRRVREIFRTHLLPHISPVDINVCPKGLVKNISYDMILSDLGTFLHETLRRTTKGCQRN